MSTGTRWIAAAAVLCGATIGCSEYQCPKGYDRRGDTCYRRNDAGARNAGDEERDASHGDADRAGYDVEVEAEADADAGRSGSDGGQSGSGAGQNGSDTAPTDAAPPFDEGEESDATATDAGTVSCAAQPCQNDGSCTDGPDGFRCSCPKPLMGERCEAWTCADTLLRTQADLARARSCAVIEGDLSIASAGIASIMASDLPYLTRVTGNLLVSGMHNNGVEAPRLRELTLAKLREIGGKLSVSETGPGSVSDIRFPELTRVDWGVFFLFSDTKRLELPALRVVGGEGFILNVLQRLCTLEIPAIEQISKQLWVMVVPNLPASALEPLRRASSGMPFETVETGIGCCLPTDRLTCGSDAVSTDALCGCSAP